jgi:hypothetical protein
LVIGLIAAIVGLSFFFTTSMLATVLSLRPPLSVAMNVTE